MKKRLLMTFVFSLLASCIAMAADYGTAGCGLGALAFKDQPGKIQIVGSIFNNLISPQTFAITSATSNCVDESSTASSKFISVNRVALQKDISRGSGESLASLSQILKCSDSAKLGRSLQMNYGHIFPTDTTPATEIDKSIQTTIKSDETLAKYCRSIG